MVKKKRAVDIDDIIESRVQDEIARVMGGIKSKVIVPDSEIFDLSVKVLCGACIFWERHNYQEDGNKIKGWCHFTPMLPERMSADWCSRGICK